MGNPKEMLICVLSSEEEMVSSFVSWFTIEIKRVFNYFQKCIISIKLALASICDIPREFEATGPAKAYQIKFGNFKKK